MTTALVIETVPLSEYYEMRDKAFGARGDSGPRDPQILSLMAEGTVTGKGDSPFQKGRVDLTVRLKIAVLTEREDWVRVRLRFGQAALRTEVPDADLGRYRITFEAPEGEEKTGTKRGEYVLWLKGARRGDHRRSDPQILRSSCRDRPTEPAGPFRPERCSHRTETNRADPKRDR